MVELRNKELLENDLYDEDDEDTQKDKFLTFMVGKEDYCIEIYHVTEIIGMQKITDVPDLPAYIKGVINLRGKVIPVIDIRMRFRMPQREYDDRTCIVVVNVSNTPVGLVVDTVREVVDIPECNIEMPPEMTESSTQHYIRGLGKIDGDVKILLSVEKLVRNEDGPALHMAAFTHQPNDELQGCSVPQ